MQTERISRFWDNYLENTRRYNIQPQTARWYVKHVERYIKAYPERRLALHTAHELTQYLDEIGRSTLAPFSEVPPYFFTCRIKRRRFCI